MFTVVKRQGQRGKALGVLYLDGPDIKKDALKKKAFLVVSEEVCTIQAVAVSRACFLCKICPIAVIAVT